MKKPVILKLLFHTVIITFDEEVGRVKAKLFPGGKEQIIHIFDNSQIKCKVHTGLRIKLPKLQ